MTPQDIAEVVNFNAFLERTGADMELARELITLLLRDLPNLTETLDKAVAAGDAKTLERTAHAIKGAVANFSARPSVAASESLERMGRFNELGQAPAALIVLKRELGRLETALTQLAESPAS